MWRGSCWGDSGECPHPRSGHESRESTLPGLDTCLGGSFAICRPLATVGFRGQRAGLPTRAQASRGEAGRRLPRRAGASDPDRTGALSLAHRELFGWSKRWSDPRSSRWTSHCWTALGRLSLLLAGPWSGPTNSPTRRPRRVSLRSRARGSSIHPVIHLRTLERSMVDPLGPMWQPLHHLFRVGLFDLSPGRSGGRRG